MYRAMMIAAIALAALSVSPRASLAQEGCKAATASCSQMNQTCERNCQNGNNPSACVARFCSVTLNTCKANGVWKAPGSPGCWKTSNRT